MNGTMKIETKISFVIHKLLPAGDDFFIKRWRQIERMGSGKDSGDEHYRIMYHNQLKLQDVIFASETMTADFIAALYKIEFRESDDGYENLENILKSAASSAGVLDYYFTNKQFGYVSSPGRLITRLLNNSGLLCCHSLSA